jgi:hypothetical protein
VTTPELQRAIRASAHRRPFRHYLIEFVSGDRLEITHPEAVDERSGLFIYHGPGFRYELFAASSVCRLPDLPSTGG